MSGQADLDTGDGGITIAGVLRLSARRPAG
jgi:hypothetical protein